MQGYCQRFMALLRWAIAVAVLPLAACSTTGSSFDASAIDLIRPGHTTLSQASALLKADPENIYRQGDGAVIARWAHRASFVPDAVYFNRELWLAFDRNGYFERIVKGINVPQAGQADLNNRSAHIQLNPSMSGDATPGLPSDSAVASPVRP